MVRVRVERIIQRVIIEPDEFRRAFGFEGWEITDAKATADGRLIVELSRRG